MNLNEVIDFIQRSTEHQANSLHGLIVFLCFGAVHGRPERVSGRLWSVIFFLVSYDTVKCGHRFLIIVVL